MKKSILFFACIAFSLNTIAQSCCTKGSSTESFAMFGNDPYFVATHLDPDPFVLQTPIGKNIAFKCDDGNEGYAYEIKAKSPTKKYLLVIHEWWGLNDYIKQESEKWYNELGDYNVIAIDLYDKKVAATRDSASKYMGDVKTKRAENIIKAVVRYIGKDAQIATVGWCFGGGWSLQTALLAGKNCKACIMYYGMPEDKIEKLKKLSAPVYMVWPEQDKWITKEVVDKFKENMKSCGKTLTVKGYDADHAFANPSNPKYSKEFSEDAFKNSINFIREYMK